jgi:anti-sigma factor RsiW
MTCATARDALLTADPAELAGRTGSELSRHLETCPACRQTAAQLVSALHALAADLVPPADGTDRVAARAALASAARRRARTRMAGRLVPLAAAAGLASLLLVRRTPPLVPTVTPAPVRIHDVSVTAPPGRSFAVLHTADPGIVVVWFF